jgi:hypothetical protein
MEKQVRFYDRFETPGGVTADWCSRLTADFTAYLTDAEVVDHCVSSWSRFGLVAVG